MIESCEKLNNQAIELASRGEYKEAIACFVRALSIENQNHLLWYNLGLTYRDAGELKEAKAAIEKAFYIKPNDEEIIETLALICYNLGVYEEAMGYVYLGLQLNNMNSHLWNTRGVLFFNTSDFINAEESFEQALSINPYYYDALFNLRDTYSELGNSIGVAECERRMKTLKRS